ncbi:amidohydrolase [Caballeronia novacaledonica]|uniref:Amidohydrolase n=1 Tax=Caballeronia novacaledonica TaxID=1544861 RepID=A0A2U3I3Y1_9BURK|nr:amidohydrolase family protein [Caballeronia novacaledonica]SPB14824.1 amidohydrolase [Caballeronia novacaledonica]
MTTQNETDTSPATVVDFRGNNDRDLKALDSWTKRRVEEALEPELPIIDPHHHIWNDERGRYLADELLADIGTGHRIEATVYMQFKANYRETGPESMRPVGEVEFASMFADACATERPEGPKLCAGIVGHADLLLGSDVQAVLDTMLEAGRGRLRGIRHGATFDSGQAGFGRAFARPHVLLDSNFREGFARLAPLNLSFDAWIFYPQLPDLISLLREFPDTNVILDHAGGILGVPPHVNRPEVFSTWRAYIQQLSQHPNLTVKIGGLGMLYCGWNYHLYSEPPTSEALAASWRPYIETCIEFFGPERCMFESNFPVDKQTCGYGVLWNAFKRVTRHYSESEKRALYRDNAARIYRLQ